MSDRKPPTNSSHRRWPILGHDTAIAFLVQTLERGQLHHAYLFAGPAGIGRTTLALTFAQALLCEAAPDERPCRQCRACRRIAKGIHPDVTQIALEEGSDEAKLLSIDRVRELRANLVLRPLEGKWRIAIIDNAERLSRDAADALLKTLEEPPTYAVLILITEDADTLPETIRSRCQLIRLSPLPIALVEQALRAHGCSHEQAVMLARKSRGRIAWALRQLNDSRALKGQEELVQSLLRAMSQPLAGIGLARRLSDRYRRGHRTEVHETLQLASELWRDALWLACDPNAPIVHEAARAQLFELAQRRGLVGTSAGLRATLQALADLEANVQVRLALLAAVVAWSGNVR